MKYLHCLTGLLILFLIACANPGSGPDGGPYDETPPKIVSMMPALGATGQKEKKITITFDELIKIEKAQEKITVSPPQLEAPDIKVNGRHITVKFNDTLKSNTTYTIDFSDAIVDNNEGNPLGQFTYYCSTGTNLDTMEVSGHVLNAQDHEPIKGILVGLHSNMNDTAFTSQPFDRVARTNSRGYFSIKGIAPGSYRIFALGDVDGDFKYTRGEQLAFSHDTIVPSSFMDVRNDTLWADTVRIDTIRQVNYTHFMPDNLVLLAFKEKNISRQLLKYSRSPEYFQTYFTAPSVYVPVVKGLNFDERGKIIENRSPGNDTITYWLCDSTLIQNDSLSVAYTYEATDDSTGVNSMRTDTLTLIPRLKYAQRKKFADEEYEKWEKKRAKRHKHGDYSQEVYPVPALDVRYDMPMELAPDCNLHFTLKEPAKSIDTAAIHLYLQEDSLYNKVPYRLERDSLSLLHYTLRSAWRPKQQYVINIDSAAITGISGRVCKAYDMKFGIAAMETFGSLFLIIPDADSTTTVQLMKGGETPYKQQKTVDKRVDFFYLVPGDYYIRAFNDRNGNGIWDPGDFEKGMMAEEVYYFPSEILVRANWDIEQTWNMRALPVGKQKPELLIRQKDTEERLPRNLNAERERNKRR